jgi:hypothetical protein
MNKALILMVLSTAPAVATAQVVTPVPAQSVPAPAWTPPPEAPKLPPLPPEPDVATPDIVKRDKDGWVIWPEKPFELVVIEAVAMDDAQRKAWMEKWNARVAQQDDAVVKNLPQAIKLRESIDGIEAITELGQLIALAEPMKPLVQQPSLEQFVKTTQIFKAKQQSAFVDGVKHFKDETLKDLNKKVGDDKNKLIIIKSRESVRDRSCEAMTSFDRMTAALATNWTKVKSTLNLSGDYGAAEAMAAKATDAKGKSAAGLALLKAVPAERQAEVLGTFRTPLPTPPKPPADPAVQGAELPKVPVSAPPVSPPAK